MSGRLERIQENNMPCSPWKNVADRYQEELEIRKTETFLRKFERNLEDIRYTISWKWQQITGIWYDIYYGIGNLFSWFPIIWRDRDWDHVFLLNMMEKKFARMSHLQEFHGNTVSHMRYAKQLKIAKVLCKRLSAEPYYDIVKYRLGQDPKRRLTGLDYKISDSLKQQDKDMLGNLIAKYIDHWWD